MPHPGTPPPAAPPPWAVDGPTLLAALGSRPEGLSAAEAAERLRRDGRNELPRARGRSALRILGAQFANALILLLAGAAVVSVFLGERVDAVVILAIVGVNGLLGFFQEYRAERAARLLRALVSHTAIVRRDGGERRLPAAELVVGDVVRLAIGDVVPTDVRLLAAEGFATDESTLTGESLPAAKDPAPLPAGLSLPQDLANLAFLGTAVAAGEGTGVVIATGVRTGLGRTASLIEAKPRPTEFQRGIERFSVLMLRVVVVMTLFVFAVNTLLGRGAFDSLLFAVALAVGITPEALPVIVTISLSRGALRMARRRVVVKRLMSVEDLGNVDTLCCDKTGTLTEGALGLAGGRGLDGADAPAVLRWGALGAGGDLAVDRALAASPEAAAAAAAGWTILDRNEFDFERRRSSALARGPAGTWLVAKGAPAAVVAAATRLGEDGARPLDGPARAALAARVATWEEEGYRVLGVALRPFAGETSAAADEHDLRLVGWLLFTDPPKATAARSVAALAALGVAVKVFSGDSPVLTRRVCGEVGIAVGERVVTGEELAALDGDAFVAAARTHDVFARVTPEQKHRLVAAVAREGHVVGFLGDGVNDAPALRAADVGVAVEGGTGIAKEAADVVLLEKSLEVLADGILEGRRTFANITKYVLNTMSANFGNMSTVAASSVFLRFIPLLPPQILLNNLLSDLPLVTLATDRVDPELCRRPRRWDLPLILRFMIFFGLVSAAFDLLLIAALLGGLATAPAAFRTAWFVESALSEIVVTFAIRTRLRWYRSRPSGWLLGSSLVAVAVGVALPWTAVGRDLFAFVPLSPAVLATVALVLAGYFAAAEVAKRAFFARWAP